MISYFIRHPVAANLLMVLMCILGAVVLSDIKRETFPEFTASRVGVSVSYPGASARDVDEQICNPLEKSLAGIPGLVKLECLSIDGRGSATAELTEGGDIGQFFNDILSAVSGVNDFPSDAESPAVEILARNDLVALVAITGVNGKQGLIEYADVLADKLLAVDGVAEASVSGVTDRELQVTFDQDALYRFGLSSRDIADAISARSLTQPLGEVDLNESSYVLRYTDVRRSIADLEDLIILQNDNGAVVRLRDLGQVRPVDKDENTESFLNGQQAAIISISKAKADDSIRVFEAVNMVLTAEQARYPAPFRIEVINNTTELVAERLQLILSNIAMGLVLVFGTMWLFFSLREALWISVALPVSFLGTLFVMSVTGVTINMITLVGLLMAVGLIMDDSIVIAENIDKWRRRTGPVEAAVKGTMEVMPGVLSSFLTTACVFGPLMFVAGQMGQVLRYIPIVLLITLALSLVEGFLILPHHLSHAGTTPGEHKNRRAARWLEALKEGVVLPVASRLVRWRYLTAGSVVGVFILTIGLVASGTVKVIGFPATESDTVVARLSLTSGIARERTIETVDQLVAALDVVNAEHSPNTQGAAPLVKRVLVEYGVNSEVNDNGANTATITVDLLESSLRNIKADDVLLAWRNAAPPLPDMVQASFAQSDLGPAGFDLDVELTSYDLEELEAASEDLQRALLQREDVVEAHQDFYGGRQEVQLALNTYGYSVGLTPEVLANQLRTAFEGIETDSFRALQSDQTVRVKLDRTLSSLTDIEQFPISVGDGKQVALARIADLTLARGYPTITRKDGQALARIQGQIDRSATTSSAISKVVTDELGPELRTKYPGLEIGIAGATAEQNESISSLATLMMLGLIGVYMILAFQFRSYTLPVVIITSVPFALIGTILAHWGLGVDISMPSLIGFASLAGIVVNNAILFMTFFESHLDGDNYETAALNAVRERFRPILLSSMTTFAGLVPIMADSSPQVQTLVPMAISVAFGLLASVVMVTLIFPALMSIYFDIFNVRRWAGQFQN
ncbi:efflux RND transporter permease subunit [Ruegeria sp.]|uniref:efflux RND transporter permease subunit n=1 Tax=Ruegeria sp. TaxID=1879320 RepID=UPI00231DF4CA|nr:efflux RND transporter permease subunit [Ruegeria sp.]MDA7963509.1 efflux RND transporter permease subunit [Ruegeria sp.]